MLMRIMEKETITYTCRGDKKHSGKLHIVRPCCRGWTYKASYVVLKLVNVLTHRTWQES